MLVTSAIESARSNGLAPASTPKTPAALSNVVGVSAPTRQRGVTFSVIKQVFENLAIRIRLAVSPSARRARNIEAEASRFHGRMRDVVTMLTSDSATTTQIVDALVDADKSGKKLHELQGSPRNELTKFGETLSTLEDAKLATLIASVHDNANGESEVADKLTGQPYIFALLMNLIHFAYDEVNDRTKDSTHRGISVATTRAVSAMTHASASGENEATIEAITQQEGEERLAEKQLREALRPISAFANLSMPEADQHAYTVVRCQPDKDRRALLMCAHPKDLTQLWQIGENLNGGISHKSFQDELINELNERPSRLAERAKPFLERMKDARSMGREFLTDLSHVADIVVSIRDHNRDHPPLLREGSLISPIESSLSSILDARENSLSHMSPARLTSLVASLRKMDFHKLAHLHLGSQIDTVFQRSATAVRNSATALCKLALAGNTSEPLIKALSELEASVEKHDAELGALGDRSGAQGSDEIMQEVIKSASKDRAHEVARFFRSPIIASLCADLRIGAAHAQGQSLVLQHGRFHRMAELLDKLANSAGNMPSLDESVSDDPEVEPLRAMLRQALRDALGLDVSKHEPSDLQSRTLPEAAVKVLADALQQPGSSNEGKHIELAPDVFVPRQFYVDIARSPETHFIATDSVPTTAPSVDSASTTAPNEASTRIPLVDSSNWDQLDGDQVKARVAAGFERLTQACGSAEEAIKAATHANQNIVAGLVSAFATVPGLFHLQDGSRGTVQVNVQDNRSAGSKQSVGITFSTGQNGRLRMDVDYTLDGRSHFSPTNPKEDPAPLHSNSTIRAHFQVELQDDGVPMLLGTPTFQFNLNIDDNPKAYGVPNFQDVLNATEGEQLYDDLLAYGRATKTSVVNTSFAFARFKKSPSLTTARDVAISNDSQAYPARLDQSIRRRVNDAYQATRREIVSVFEPTAAVVLERLNEEYDRIRDTLHEGHSPHWPKRFPLPPTFQELIEKARTSQVNDPDFYLSPARIAAGLVYQRFSMASHTVDLATFHRQFQNLIHGNDGSTDAFAHADKLYENFLALNKSATGDLLRSRLPDNDADTIRRQLAQIRNNPVSGNLFGDLEADLAQEMENLVIPGMIEHSRRSSNP